jgi:hypothetical protein
MVSVNRATASSIEIAHELGFENDSKNPDLGALEQLQAHGRWLKNIYDIRQFVLLGRSELITEFRQRFS